MKKIVIAGGMGSGKSKLIRLLEGNGFSVIDEVITKLNEEGNNADDPNFYDLVFSKQLELEDVIKPKKGDVVFLDRSNIDLLAFYAIRLMPLTKELFNYEPDFSDVFFINAVVDEGQAKRIASFNKKDYINFANRGYYNLHILQHDSTDNLYNKISNILNL